MVAATKEQAAPARWRSVGTRLHPEVHRALKVAAAMEGETIEELLHAVLVPELRRRGVLPEDFDA